MYLSMLQLKDLRDKLRAAKQAVIDGDPRLDCQARYTVNGKPYRLEPKPRAREYMLQKHGHPYETINGVLHVQVSLGTHGTDHLGIDPATGDIVCLLCQGGR